MACKNSGLNADEQLVEVNKLSKRNNNANVNIQDYKLPRYICYLLVQNANQIKKLLLCGKLILPFKQDIINWLRNRITLEFLGTWESIYNPNFNSVEFDGFRINAELYTLI